jgi:hypothetical protein
MKFDIAQSTVTTKRHTLTITREKLVGLLATAGVEVPKDADIFVEVPGGGDWSHMDLDIDQSPINIRFTTTEES